MQEYRKLRVWEESTDLAVEVYGLTDVFPPDERFNLTSQIRRAAVSVPSNIAEGCGRSGKKERARVFDIALGSACELESQLELCRRLGFSDDLAGGSGCM